MLYFLWFPGGGGGGGGSLYISVVRLLIFHNRSSKIIGQEVSIED